MDNRQALAILVQQSVLFDAAGKESILAKIPSMEDSDVAALGKILAAEFDDAKKNIDADIANAEAILSRLDEMEKAKYPAA